MGLEEDADIDIEVNKAGMHPFSTKGRRFGFTIAGFVFFFLTFWATRDFTSSLAALAIPFGVGSAIAGIHPFGVEIVWHALTDRV